MGLYQKIDNGNYMGDATKREAKRPKDAALPKADFKRGAILKGLPGREDNFPKAGKDIAPSFQDMRNQDPAKGRI